MAELHDRFRSLDRIAVPDLWADVEERAAAAAPKPLSPVGVPWSGLGRSELTRSRPFRLALVLAALILLLLALALATGGRDRFTSPLVFATSAGEGGQALYVVDWPGADPKRIFERSASGILVSPDGKDVSFESAGGTTVARTDGTSSRTFPDTSGTAWASDSHAVAGVWWRGDQYTVTIMDVDGGEPRRIAVPARTEPHLAWSPDNVHLVYTGFEPADPEAGCWTIASMLIVDINSGGFREIGPLYPARPPVWSHDGRHFAAAVWPQEGPPPEPCAALPSDGLALVTVGATTGRITTVMNAPDVDHLAWSADDRSILGLMAGSGGYDSFAVPADGGAVKTLAHLGGNVGVQSPDGSQLARVELDDESTETYSLWVIDLADGQRRRVARDVPYAGSDSDGWPLWSPDGEWIAFHREPSSPTYEYEWPYVSRVGGEGSIWIVRPDGSDEQLIVDDSIGVDVRGVDW